MNEPLNILFIMTDQLRCDYVGQHPNSLCETPNMDALCGDHVFLRCNSVNPVCLPTRTALLTGRYPHQIGTVHMSGDLNPDIPTFAQALQKAGYETFGVGKFHYLQGWDWSTPEGQGFHLTELRPFFNDLGFEHVWQVCGKSQMSRNYCDYGALLESHGLLQAYRDDLRSRGKNIGDADTEAVDCTPFSFPEEFYVDRVTADKALEYLENRDTERPFFAQVSFCGPHPPYDAPASKFERTEYIERDDFVGAGRALSDSGKRMQHQKRKNYLAMIREIDEQVGRIKSFLEKNELLENTVVILSSDHGEMMGDHALSQKCSPYWQSARVPFYMSHPDFKERKRHECLVEQIDLTATILDCAGLNPQEALSRDWPYGNNQIPARSILPYLSGAKANHRESIYSECYGNWQMIETSDSKFVRQIRKDTNDPIEIEYYDLVADPNEESNLYPDSVDQRKIDRMEAMRIALLETTPPVQTRWVKR